MSLAATASRGAWVNESGRLARSVATATQRPVIRSWRSWGTVFPLREAAGSLIIPKVDLPPKLSPIATFSIAAADPEAHECGVAVASKFLAVGVVVPWARAGVGAVATQAWANLSYGPDGLRLLAEGVAPVEVIERLTHADAMASHRQVGVVDMQGRSATFTGEQCMPWAGGRTAPGVAVQGNILVSEETVATMLAVFLGTPGRLAARLLAALYAGDQAGGDSRGRQSAALLVVKPGAGYGGFNDRYPDLRGDDHPHPVVELGRIFVLVQPSFLKAPASGVMPLHSGPAARLRLLPGGRWQPCRWRSSASTPNARWQVRSRSPSMPNKRT